MKNSISKKEDFPSEIHYAVLVFSKLVGTGMRQDGMFNSNIRYLAFESEDELKQWILANNGVQDYTVIKVNPVNINITINLE